MNPLLVGGLIEAVGRIADNLITTDKERLAAQIEMQKLGLEAARLEADVDRAQIDLNKAETQHRSLFVAGWRPAIGWIGAIALAYQFVLYPLLVWAWHAARAAGALDAGAVPPPVLDTDALWVILAGMLGIAGMRSWEKSKGLAR